MLQTTLFDAIDPLDDQPEVGSAAPWLRDAGVYIGRPEEIASDTLAAVSVGAQPTASERVESRRYVNRCAGCWMPRTSCQCGYRVDADYEADRRLDQERGK